MVLKQHISFLAQVIQIHVVSHLGYSHTWSHQRHTHLDIISLCASVLEDARDPMTNPRLMWLARASLVLSPQVGISQQLQLLCMLLNSTHFKMPASMHRQEGLVGVSPAGIIM